MLGHLKQACRTLLLLALLPLPVNSAPAVEPSGFLQDSNLLRRGHNGEPVWIYRNPHKSIGDYDKILIDPIVVLPKDDQLKGIRPAELELLIRYFRYVGISALSDAYTIVSKPGTGVMRVRVAISNLIPSKPCLLSLSALPGPVRAVSMCRLLKEGSYLFAGNAAIEAELVDSETNETIVAMVDRRGDDHKFVGKNTKWSHIMHAFEEWALLLRTRLDQAHAENLSGD